MDEWNPGQLTAGAVFHGRYQIVRRIKAGGMGAVYEVIHLETRRRRALKVMLPSVVSDPELRDRFKQEATIAADITSDHIVETFDAGVDSETGTPFLVMELLQGEDLSQPLKERGKLTPAEVVPLLTQAALALDKTHAAGIVHRDLKPENLFITRSDNGAIRLKVLDFGIAKVVAQSDKVNNTTRAIGSPLYMSPEQLRGRGNLGPPADLYALAHLAYKLLTGTSYWEPERRDADNILALMATIGEGASEAATARAARAGVELPPAFDAWFAKATAVRPEDRHPSASALAADLAVALDQPAHSAALDQLAARLPAGSSATLPAAVMPSNTGATTAGVSATSNAQPGGVRRRFVVAALIAGAALAIAAPRVASYLAPEEPSLSAAAPPAITGSPAPEPTPESLPAPTAEPTAVASSSAMAPSASARRPSATPGPPASAAAADPSSAPKRPFNAAQATQIVAEKAKIAGQLCKGRAGPRVVPMNVVFNENGIVRRVTTDPTLQVTPGGNCAIGVMFSSKIPSFDGPGLPVSASVVLE